MSSISSYDNSYIIKYGFKRGVALTYLYAIIFIIYVIARTSGTIINQLAHEDGLYSTLFANATSVLISSLAIATLVSIFAGFLGMLTALLIRWLLKKQTRGYTNFHPGLSGFLTCLLLGLMLHVFLFAVTGISWTKYSPEAYWFWFGFPTIIYIITGSSWAIKFHKRYIHLDKKYTYSREM